MEMMLEGTRTHKHSHMNQGERAQPPALHTYFLFIVDATSLF